MSRLLVAAVLALSAQLGYAASASSSIRHIVDLALKKGEAASVGARTSRDFKLKEGTPSKLLWHDQGTLDQYEHVFEVVMQKEKPQGILIQKYKMIEADGKQSYQGWDFFLDTNGKLKHAVEYAGVVGSPISTPLKSAAAKKLLAEEQKFWSSNLSASQPSGK